MDSARLARWRMHRLHLWGPRLGDPVEVVGYLGALQAQEFAFAKWSVAQRTKDVDDAAMQRLFDAGAILRTHLLRPTWHFVLPADIRWLLDLTAPRVHALNAYMYRQLDVNPKHLAKSHRLLSKSLAGGSHMTRREIAGLLKGAGIDAAGLRLGYFLMRAELDGLICSGARRGKQQTYALLEERAPGAKSMDGDDALIELTRRYFTSRGPATVRDYSRWSSLKMADCKRGLQLLDSELEHEVVDGRTYWFAPSSPPSKPASQVADLVQVYDECVMSYSESRDVLGDSPIDPNASYMHVVLLDGRLAGHWKPVDKGAVVEIETLFYGQLGRGATKAFHEAVDRYSRFVRKPANVV